MWRNWNPWALWLTCINKMGAAATENSMEVPQKIKNRINIWFSNSTSVYLSKGIESRISKRFCTLIFIAALFTVAKMWKQPKLITEKPKLIIIRHRMDEWINKMWYYINQCFPEPTGCVNIHVFQYVCVCVYTHTHTHTYIHIPVQVWSPDNQGIWYCRFHYES